MRPKTTWTAKFFAWRFFPSFSSHSFRRMSFAVLQKLENLGDASRVHARESARARSRYFTLGLQVITDDRNTLTAAIIGGGLSQFGLGRRFFLQQLCWSFARPSDRSADACNARGRFDRFDNRDDYVDKWRDFAKRRLLFRIRFELSLVSLARIFARRSGGGEGEDNWWLRDLNFR